jgi:hypothetical protein
LVFVPLKSGSQKVAAVVALRWGSHCSILTERLVRKLLGAINGKSSPEAGGPEGMGRASLKNHKRCCV